MRSVNALKLWTREASYVLSGLFQGAIDAAGDGENGKGKKGNGKGKGKDKSKNKNGVGGKGKDRGNNWNSEASRQRSSKAVALTVRSGVTSAHSVEHVWLSRQLEQLLYLKNPKRQEKGSSRRIGATPKTMTLRSMRRFGVLRTGQPREGRHVACRQWSG